jgi:hypothetical protein
VITTPTGRKLNASNLRRDVLRSGGSMPSTGLDLNNPPEMELPDLLSV